MDTKRKRKKQIDLNFVVPKVFSHLNRFERVLISRQILFKKDIIMVKGRFAKFSGSICYSPIDTADIVEILPSGADSNDLEVVKLRCKL